MATINIPTDKSLKCEILRIFQSFLCNFTNVTMEALLEIWIEQCNMYNEVKEKSNYSVFSIFISHYL